MENIFKDKLPSQKLAVLLLFLYYTMGLTVMTNNKILIAVHGLFIVITTIVILVCMHKEK
jgi:hypothetical protein